MLTGYKTIAINLAVIMAVAGLQYLANVDWTHLLPLPLIWATPIIISAINLALRFVTTSPALGRKPADA